MPYIKKTYKTGNIIEVEKVHSGRYGKRTKHNPKTNPTPEDVKKVNERNSIKKLRRIINANFGFGDYHLTLTYKKKNRPEPDKSKKIISKFLDNLRKAYKASETELKYIFVTEYKNKSIHHHVIINDSDNLKVLQIVRKFWKNGSVYPTILDDTGQYGNLAAYLIKETQETFRENSNPNKLRYSTSRNLIRPEPDVEIIQANTWVEVPVPIKGYWIDKNSIAVGISKINGYGYQYYTMIKYDPDNPAMQEDENWIKPRRRNATTESRGDPYKIGA